MTFRLHQVVTLTIDGTITTGTIVQVHNATSFEVETDDGVHTVTADDLTDIDTYLLDQLTFECMSDEETDAIDWYHETDTHKIAEHIGSIDYAKFCAVRDLLHLKARGEAGDTIVLNDLSPDDRRKALWGAFEKADAAIEAGQTIRLTGMSDEQLEAHWRETLNVRDFGDHTLIGHLPMGHDDIELPDFNDPTFLDQFEDRSLKATTHYHVPFHVLDFSEGGEPGLSDDPCCYCPTDEQRDRLLAAEANGTFIDLSHLTTEQYRERIYAMRADYLRRRDGDDL